MTTSGPSPRWARLLPFVGFFVAVALAGWAMALPALTGWNVHVNTFPPLHADWDPRVGAGTVPAVLLGLLAAWQAVPLAGRLRWGLLLLSSYVAGLAWLLSLAYVDGRDGVAKILDEPYEYLPTARAVTDLPHTLSIFVSRIAVSERPPGTTLWPVHVAGHPPGALVMFVVLARLGLGSGFAAGVVVTLLAASTAVAVMLTLRLLGAEQVARRAAPFLVFGPAAVWQCVSADGAFAAVAAWGMAALAAATVRRSMVWGLVSGLLLGYAVMLSYGLPLMGLLAAAVLVVGRSWRPLPWAAIGALVVVGVFTAYGYHYWEALPLLHERQYAGVAHNRPPTYWWWGNLAALAFSAGPMAYAGVAGLWARTPETRAQPDATRTVRWLTGATVLMVAFADASQASKGEVERIWLPFVPWLLISTGLLPRRWLRPGLVAQILLALVVQHLLFTGW
jgi:hypothetical protein